MGNSNLTTALVIVLCLELVMILGQVAVSNINPEGTVFQNESLFTTLTMSDGTTLNDTITGDVLPSAGSGVDVDSSEYTDSISSVRSWAFGNTGQRILVTLLFGPSVYLTYMRAPAELVLAVGGLWFCLTVLLIVGFFTGRNS